MALCDTEVIEKLNHYFVPFFADDLAVMQSDSWKGLYNGDDLPGRTLVETLRTRFIPSGHEKYKNPPLIQIFIITPAGEIADTDFAMIPSPRELILKHIDTWIEKLHVSKGPILGRYRSHPATDPSAESMGIRVVLRYTDPEFLSQMPRFHPASRNMDGFVYAPDPRAPTRDWISLQKSEWQSLLPPPALPVGGTYEIDTQVAKKILVHFRPEPSPPDGDPVTRVTEAKITGEVCSIDSHEGVVRLVASMNMLEPGQRLPRFGSTPSQNDRNHVEAVLDGYLKFNPKTSQIQDLRMTTTAAALFNPTGDALSFEGVAYQVAQPTQVQASLDHEHD